MSWLQLSFDIDKDQSELLEYLLEEAGALSVTFADAGDQPLFEPQPGTTPLWQQIQLIALFDENTELTELLATLRAGFTESAANATWPEPVCETLLDKDWEREWMDKFKPIRFGPRLWVCPSWHQPPDPKAVNLMLDPGLAFGTGTHPTTAQCLEWLDGQQLTGKSVIDYGCGSGILAIAALKLGAGSAIATDIDPQALKATQDNARQNAINSEQLTCYLPKNMPQTQADLVIANILAGPLIELYPQLSAVSKPGGQLLLSGILEDQAEQLIATYRQSFVFDPIRQRDGWVLLSASKRMSL